MAEETTAATTSLSEQAQELRELVQQFAVGEVDPAQNALGGPEAYAPPVAAIDFDADDWEDQDFGSSAAA